MENKSYLMKSAALFGLYMGIFWVLKYLLVIFGGNNEYFNALYMGFTVSVPFIAYLFTKHYREQTGNEIFSFFHAWQFGMLLYTFAAIIVSLIHFYYYKYILGPEGISEAMNQTLSLLSSYKIDSSLLKQVEDITTPSPFQMTVQGILNNILGGAILSIPVALLVKRENKPI